MVIASLATPPRWQDHPLAGVHTFVRSKRSLYSRSHANYAEQDSLDVGR